MKKFLCFTLIICSVFLLTGCGKEEEQVIIEQETLGKLENLKIVKTKRIADDSIVFILKNKDEYPIKDTLVTIEFWKKGNENAENDEDKIDKLVGESNEAFQIISAGQTVAGSISNGKREFDYYKVFLDEKPDTKTKKMVNDYDNFLFDDNTVLEAPPLCENEPENANCVEKEVEVSENLMLTVKNKGEEKMNYFSVAVVFYEGNNIVGFSSANGTNLQSKKLRDITVYYPKNNKTKQMIKFDNYTVYPVLIYHNNIG